MADTLSRRAVIGVLVPFFNSVVEPELASLRPSGVGNQTARFELDADVLQNVTTGGEQLLTCGVEALVVGLAPESFPGGLALLQQGVDDLKEKTGVPVHAASFAVHAALRTIGVKKIGVVTPFDAEGNTHVKAAFEEKGFDVVGIEGLNCAAFDRIAHTPHADIMAAFRTVDTSEAQALVHVGTGLPVVDLVEEMEQHHGKTVIACNAAMYWEALRGLGIADAIHGVGRLLREF
jgi:maleate isomerase